MRKPIDQTRWNGAVRSKVSSEPQFDPALGEVIQEVWVGTKSGIYELAGAMQAQGNRYTMTNEGPVYKLTVNLGVRPDEANEVPVDSYDFDTEFAQPSLWISDRVFKLAGSQSVLTQWRRQCENAMKGIKTDGSKDENGGPLDESATGFTGNQLSIYRLLVRGTESVEVAKIVLARTRTVSNRYAGRMQMESAEKIYTSAALAFAFGIPSDVVAKMPADPADIPIDTAWSWKVRKQSSRLLRRESRVEESINWTFAAWSTVLYELITATE